MEIKELIDRLKNNGCDGCTYRPVCMDDDTAECSIRVESGVTVERLSDELEKVTSELEAAIREQEERRWIPVTELLPENICPVLVVLEGISTAFNGWYHDGKWWKVGAGTRPFKQKVTHWMPLPEPPKEAALLDEEV